VLVRMGGMREGGRRECEFLYQCVIVYVIYNNNVYILYSTT